jgi:hypothetical protein
MKAAGQDLLDDILTHPLSVHTPITAGNFAGGTYVAVLRQYLAAFDKAGVFQYFGKAK